MSFRSYFMPAGIAQKRRRACWTEKIEPRDARGQLLTRSPDMNHVAYVAFMLRGAAELDWGPLKLL
jgi:hypothetical protein